MRTIDRVIAALLLLFSASTTFAMEVVFLSNGDAITIHDDGTWTPLERETGEVEAMTELNFQGIVITAEEVKIIGTFMDGDLAGIKFKIKNNSDMTVNKLNVTVYYLDREGRPFFETTRTLVDSESWTGPTVLKPNYTLRYPASNTSYATAEGLDLKEWDEGAISFEVAELVEANDE